MARILAPVAEVDLVSLVHDEEESSHAGDLRNHVATATVVRVPRWRNRIRALPALTSATPLTHVLLDAPDLRLVLAKAVARRPDVVLAYCSGIARAALDPMLDGVPLVLDMVDVDSEKWAQLACASTAPVRWIYRREARLLAQFETAATRRAFCTTVVNERERAALVRLAPGARIEVVENGVDLAALTPTAPPADSHDVIFCGVMNYRPNVDGALWLAREVWPHIRARYPPARLVLVGSSPTSQIEKLAESPDITVTGSVPDVKPYLWRGAVAVAPLQVARGVQNKVLEAVAAGLPAVITTQVSKGLPAEILPACAVADEPQAFADRVIELLGQSAGERRDRAQRANLARLSWEHRLARLPQLLSEAAANRGIRRR